MAMQHDRQDGVDARRRAERDHIPEWHPLLSAVETEPGVWRMVTPQGRPYAIVRSIEVGGERGYRAVTWAESSADRRLIGYYRTLRAATKAAHDVLIESHRRIGMTGTPRRGR